jgi:hypothetical protein
MAERFGSEFEVMPDTYLLPEDAPAFHAALRESSGRASGRADLWILKNLSVPLGPQLAFGAGKQIIAADAPPAHLPTTGQVSALRGALTHASHCHSFTQDLTHSPFACLTHRPDPRDPLCFGRGR